MWPTRILPYTGRALFPTLLTSLFLSLSLLLYLSLSFPLALCWAYPSVAPALRNVRVLDLFVVKQEKGNMLASHTPSASASACTPSAPPPNLPYNASRTLF